MVFSLPSPRAALALVVGSGLVSVLLFAVAETSPGCPDGYVAISATTCEQTSAARWAPVVAVLAVGNGVWLGVQVWRAWRIRRWSITDPTRAYVAMKTDPLVSYIVAPPRQPGDTDRIAEVAAARERQKEARERMRRARDSDPA